MSLGGVRKRAGRRTGVAGHHDVHLPDTVEKSVTHRAPDQPCLLAGQRRARGAGGGRALDARNRVRQGRLAPAAAMRGTRGEIPHVTS